jgi:signal transduction histidine kinase
MSVGAHIETAMPRLGTPARAARHALLPAIERRLVKIGPVRATAVLLLSGLAFGQTLHLIIGAFGTPLFSRTMLTCTALVTLVVTAPVLFHSQVLISRLVRSRRSLAELTEQLALAVDEAKAATEAKSRFFANASHELRTPLNAIIGFSQMLSAQSLGPIGQPRYGEYAEDIHGSAQHLLSLVNDLLDLALSQASDAKRNSSGDCDLRQIIDEAMRMVWPTAERTGVRLEQSIAPDVGGLRANERMVKQILLNVLSNAVKFAPGGEVSLSAHVARNGVLAIEVADTGIGMSAADIAVALTPFGQIANAITRTQAGTGLGLPLAKAMTEMLDGTLSVRSETGCGTVVTLRFPATRIIAPVADARVPALQD